MDNFNSQISPIKTDPAYLSFRGTVMGIRDFQDTSRHSGGCTKIFEVQDESGNIVNFVVTPRTYFFRQIKIYVGMPVIGFYDASAPAILIFPPQFEAIVMGLDNGWETIMVDYFDNSLLNQGGTLKLNVTGMTDIILENGQNFTGNLASRDLAVLYGPSTRSIPSITTPTQIVVLCPEK